MTRPIKIPVLLSLIADGIVNDPDGPRDESDGIDYIRILKYPADATARARMFQKEADIITKINASSVQADGTISQPATPCNTSDCLPETVKPTTFYFIATVGGTAATAGSDSITFQVRFVPRHEDPITITTRLRHDYATSARGRC